jgi:hypothetical protein
MRVGSIYAQGPNPSIFATGDIVSNNGSHVLSGKRKTYPSICLYPNKPGWRLRHVCIVGPEICSLLQRKSSRRWYYSSSIFLGRLVNPEDMTINITPIGFWQELFVQEIRWGKQVVVRKVIRQFN